MRIQVFVAVVLVLLLRLPFLNVAAQWDDFNYLTAAEYALQDPLHPAHVRFAFLGEMHDMRGHPHPPGPAWTLTLLWRVLGRFSEIPFHAAYLGFNVLAALAALVLARRCAPDQALVATAIFCATPAFAVSGTSFESDLPFLACWLAAAAFLVEAVERNRRLLLAGAGVAAGAAALYAYQAVLLLPVLGLYLLIRKNRDPLVWGVLIVPFSVIGGYQVFERVSTGVWPFSVLAGHMQNKGWDGLAHKMDNGIALSAHLAFMAPVTLLPFAARSLPKWSWPAALLVAVGIARSRDDTSPLLIIPLALGILTVAWLFTRLREQRFLAGWTLLFFAASLVIFFAGAQRYLVPLALPLVALICLQLKDRPGLLWSGFAFQAALALAVALVNADHWNQTRTFALSLPTHTGRTLVSGEWGLRWYMEQAGAKPLLVHQSLYPGDRLVENSLNGRLPFEVRGGTLATRKEAEVIPRLPLRIAGLGARSGYAAVSFGLRPFDIGNAPVDRLRVSEVIPIAPELSWLTMNAPSVDTQILEGVHGLEQNEWRWSARKAGVLLKADPDARWAAADVFLPDQSPARRFTLTLNGERLGEVTLPGPGAHRIQFDCPPVTGLVRLEIEADADFSTAQDSRPLSFILKAAGLLPAPPR